MKIDANVKQGLGYRSIQQDCVGLAGPSEKEDKGLLAVLSDGIGGMAGGEKYSQLAVDEMLSSFKEEEALLEIEDMTEVLLTSYAKTRKAALELSETGVDGGATLVAFLCWRDYGAFVSAGDSRIYLLRNKGLILLNRQQVVGPDLDEKAAFGLIYPEEAEYNLYRKALLNHVAEKADLPCDYGDHPFRLLSGDVIALLSDGVFQTLSEEEIAEVLSSSSEDKAKELIEAVANRHMEKQDNYSAIVLTAYEDEG